MPFNGSGVYSLPQTAFVTNTTISSSAVNSDFSDISAALTTAYQAVPLFTKVTSAQFRDSGALSVVGRSLNSTGVVADISATPASGQVLVETGSTVAFSTVATAGITDASVTNAKLANMVQSTIKGRASGAGTGVPVDLTIAQAVAILGIPANNRVFTSSSTYPAVTNGAVKVLVYCKGGGGGGAGFVGSPVGGSGGEGSESWKLTTAAALSGLSVAVGAGGSAVTINA